MADCYQLGLARLNVYGDDVDEDDVADDGAYVINIVDDVDDAGIEVGITLRL